MHIPLGRLLLSALLAAGAVVCWTASNIAEELAGRHERLATLREVRDDMPPGGWRGRIAAFVDADATRHAATANYWDRRYEAFGDDNSTTETDAGASLIAANAAFRKSQRDAVGRPLDSDQIDRALHAYAGVLQKGGFSRDAAYNYEFVARLRDVTRRSRARTQAAPETPTIHGRPGTHPPPTRGDEFEVLTPMDFGDREAQPEATPGVKRPRKG
jgi:hypothetical protein